MTDVAIGKRQAIGDAQVPIDAECAGEIDSKIV